ncbi:CLUMA_CG019422, isoform A [Clunio marinus]|uniref:CLUMA_CG019422, isoform A n=1 Tax=Clunio marinus TaxID=568069 RepID=A0A1J1J6X6_9DIPT|nr:CLUMA_CG019422, isoform A [Clunio marinus]
MKLLFWIIMLVVVISAFAEEKKLCPWKLCPAGKALNDDCECGCIHSLADKSKIAKILAKN